MPRRRRIHQTAVPYTLDTGDALTLRDFEERELRSLGDREQFIIRSVFGLGEQSKAAGEVGRELGISEERVRQIRNIALRKLKKAREEKVTSAEQESSEEANPPTTPHQAGILPPPFEAPELRDRIVNYLTAAGTPLRRPDIARRFKADAEPWVVAASIGVLLSEGRIRAVDGTNGTRRYEAVVP